MRSIFLENNTETTEDHIHQEIIYQETLRLLHAAVSQLPKQSRKIILLGLEGKNNQEIAEEMGISINTIKTLKKNAYRFLREELKDFSPDMLFIVLLSCDFL